MQQETQPEEVTKPESQLAQWRGKPRYKHVDWSRSDDDLAAELGASPATVRAARTRHDPNYRRPDGKKSKMRKRGYRDKSYSYAGVDWTKRNAQIAKERGIASPVSVQAARKKYAPSHLKKLPRSSKYEHANWDLSDVELSEKYGVTLSAIEQARAKYGSAPKPEPQQTT